MDVTIKLEEKNLSVDFDEQYQVKDVSNIGNVEIVMLKGEKGDRGEKGGDLSEYDVAPIITDTASGNPAHITDAIDGYPVKSAVIDVVPVQDGSGDPSPTNIRPITGWTGAKVYVSRTAPVSGGSYTPTATVAFPEPAAPRNLFINTGVSDVAALEYLPRLYGQTENSFAEPNTGVFTTATHGFRLTATANKVHIRYRMGASTVWSMRGLKTETPYTISFDYTVKMYSKGTSTAGYYFRFYVYDNHADQSDYGQAVRENILLITPDMYGVEQTGHFDCTFSLDSATTAAYLWYGSASAYNGSGDYIELRNLMLVEGETPATYTPAPEDVGGYTGTVYGGTLDATGGAMTITQQVDTFDGSSDENWTRAGTLGSRQYYRATTKKSYKNLNHGIVGVSANWLPAISDAQDTSYALSSLRLRSSSAASNYLFVIIGTDLPSITDVDKLKEYLAENPLQVSYPLPEAETMSVEPVEIQTLGGENYIWADCGAVDVEYCADTASRTSTARILDLIYPVGSVYTSVNDVSPATFIGGTWERFGAGRFLMGVDSGTAETTGGASSVTLQASQIPSHTHTTRVESPNADAGIAKAIANSATVSTSTYTTEYINSFSGATNPSEVSILPPYVTVYFWKRTA